MDRPTRMPGIDNFFVRYSLAVMATGIALALTLWLAPVVKPAVFLFFFAAVVLVAAIGGMGPAVLTAVLGFLTGEHFVVLPIYGFQFGVGIAARAIGFTVIAAFAGWMSDRQRKANASLREAHERLQAQAEQLKEQSRKLEVAYQDLNTRADELARTNQNLDLAHQEAERRAAEADERSRILKALMDYIPEGIAVAEAPDVKIRMISRSGQEVVGDPGSGRTLFELAENCRVYDRDGKTPIAVEDRPIIRAIRQGEVVLDREMLIVNAAGRNFWVSTNAAPIRDSQGEIVGAVSAWRDITDRKNAAEARHKSEFLLRTITETSEDAICVKDRNSRLLLVNPATLRILGKPVEQIVGHTDAEFYDDPAVGAAILENDRRLMVRGTPQIFEEIIETPCGLRTMMSSKVPWRDSEGRVIGLIGISSDITERKRTEEALKEADRRKDEFLAMLAHELRNPLAAISTAVEVLKRCGPIDPGMERACDAAARQTVHMARLLDDLLDVSRVTRGKVTLQKEDLSLGSILESAIEASNPLMKRRNHRLLVSHPREPMHVMGDKVRLAQAICNLLHNSAKYTPAGGDIYLGIDRDGDNAVITVRDNGVGIEPELLPHVFDLFVQGIRSADRSEGGLGIGLTLVRSLTELHGGTVEGHSHGRGKGSEFRIRLPLVFAPDQRLGHPLSGETEKLKPLRILVVDDNADTAEMLASLLTIEGHDVIVANCGCAAIDLALSRVPDIALVDIGMPGMDGHEVAKRLRQEPTLKDMTLVAVTGYGQQEDVQKSREAGFDQHLVKPVDVGILARVLRQANQ